MPFGIVHGIFRTEFDVKTLRQTRYSYCGLKDSQFSSSGPLFSVFASQVDCYGCLNAKTLLKVFESMSGKKI